MHESRIIFIYIIQYVALIAGEIMQTPDAKQHYLVRFLLW